MEMKGWAGILVQVSSSYKKVPYCKGNNILEPEYYVV